MAKKLPLDNNSDNLALNAYNIFRASLLFWVVAWFTTIVVTDDGWAIIAGFFIGLVMTSLFFLAAGLMAITALIGGTQYEYKAGITAVTGVSLFIVVVLFYTL